MNPYLEQPDLWHMFHEHLIVHCSEILASTLEPQYLVSFDANIYLHERSADERRPFGRHDVGLVPGTRGTVSNSGGTATASSAPAYGYAIPAVDELKESFIEIHDRLGRELVTVMEILSPSNKQPGSDREQYLAKRRMYMKSAANFIEIDLLRGGPRMPLDGMPQCDYCVIVKRAEEQPRVGIWPIMLRDELPTIPIPLRSPDPDGTLDLQALLHRVYDAGRYGNKIRFGKPEPALRSDDQAWAEGILAQSASQ